jgi:hypothetical protein
VFGQQSRLIASDVGRGHAPSAIGSDDEARCPLPPIATAEYSNTLAVTLQDSHDGFHQGGFAGAAQG